MTEKKPSYKALLTKATPIFNRFRGYSFVAFLVFVALIYALVLLRISSLRSVEPSPDAVSSQVKAARIPNIDKAVVKQLESLQDNSVSVQALFDEARSNPFEQEDQN